VTLSEAVLEDTGRYPGDGVVGRERGTWYAVDILRILSGTIGAADVGAIPASSSFNLNNGSYRVEARLIDFAGSLCVSRIRVRSGSTVGASGKMICEISVDFGAVVVADFKHIRESLDEQEQRELNNTALLLMDEKFCRRKSVSVGHTKIDIVICNCTLGDGKYPVFAIERGGHVIGIEIRLIPNGYMLP
jgi:hypothetical protein